LIDLFVVPSYDATHIFRLGAQWWIAEEDAQGMSPLWTEEAFAEMVPRLARSR